MWRLTKPRMKAEGGVEEEEQADGGAQERKKRERVSGARLVCQSPSIPLTMQPYKQTLTDTVTTHTNTHTHYIPTMSPHFETPQNAVVKGVGA